MSLTTERKFFFVAITVRNFVVDGLAKVDKHPARHDAQDEHQHVDETRLCGRAKRNHFAAARAQRVTTTKRDVKSFSAHQQLQAAPTQQVAVLQAQQAKQGAVDSMHLNKFFLF